MTQAILTPQMVDLIETWRLGFVATVSVGGFPNVSPKGTFVVLDNSTVAFGEIRSPKTVTNIQTQPQVEVNFVNPLSRKGLRLRGQAKPIRRGTAEFDQLFPRFSAEWGELSDRINLIVKIPIDALAPLSSPAYDMGATEPELIATYKQKMQDYNG